MSAKDLILSIDNGTQSVRALVFDLEGRLVAKRVAPIKPYFARNPGWAEQDVDVFWQAVCRVCREMWEIEKVSKDRVA